MSSAKEWREVKATAALRDRIAAAIEAQHVSEYQGGIHPEDVLRVADAVIAELGLHPAESLDRRFIRWVTAWRNNPELGDSHE